MSVKRPAKTAKKTAKAPALVSQPGGRGALLTGGVPGNAGGTGRPPNWLKQWCDDMLADPAARVALQRALQGEDVPATTLTAWKLVSERAHGKPLQAVELSGEVGTRIVRVPAKAPSAEAWARDVKAAK